MEKKIISLLPFYKCTPAQEKKNQLYSFTTESRGNKEACGADSDAVLNALCRSWASLWPVGTSHTSPSSCFLPPPPHSPSASHLSCSNSPFHPLKTCGLTSVGTFDYLFFIVFKGKFKSTIKSFCLVGLIPHNQCYNTQLCHLKLIFIILISSNISNICASLCKWAFVKTFHWADSLSVSALISNEKCVKRVRNEASIVPWLHRLHENHLVTSRV